MPSEINTFTLRKAIRSSSGIAITRSIFPQCDARSSSDCLWHIADMRSYATSDRQDQNLLALGRLHRGSGIGDRRSPTGRAEHTDVPCSFQTATYRGNRRSPHLNGVSPKSARLCVIQILRALTETANIDPGTQFRGLEKFMSCRGTSMTIAKPFNERRCDAGGGSSANL